MLKRILLTIMLLLSSAPAFATPTTWYIRSDGGTCADIVSHYQDVSGGEVSHTRQCIGTTDAAYPGSGTNQACACNHPNWVLPISGQVTTAQAQAGDTVIIDWEDHANPGTAYRYRMGCADTSNCMDWETNIRESSTCHSSYTDTCYMAPITSGSSSSAKTKIYGKGWASGCEYQTILSGVGQVEKIINLLGSSNVDLRCLKLTDASSCTTQGPYGVTSCTKTTSDTSAMDGIHAHNSSNIFMQDVTVWGVGHNGLDTGSITDWTLDNFLVRYAGWTGFEMDRGHSAGDTEVNGTFTWTGGGIQWAGCSDDYPNDVPKNCVGQNQGIAADGFGAYEIGGDFYFDGVDISHNQGDGLDLLYHRIPTHEIHIRNSKFEGNAGNQLKLAGGVDGVITVENSIIVGNCSYFNDKPFQLYSPTQTGRSGTNCDHDATCDANENYSPAGCSVDTGGDCQTSTSCRSGGDAVAIDWATGMNVKFYNSTIAGSDGGYVFLNVNNYHATTPCDASEVFQLRNMLIDGSTDYSPGLYGISDCASLTPDIDYVSLYDARLDGSGCSGYTHKTCTDTKLTGFDGNEIFDANIASDSPAVDQGLTSITCNGDCTVDYNSFSRGLSWDIGALENGSSSSSGRVTATGRTAASARSSATGRTEASGRVSVGGP